MKFVVCLVAAAIAAHGLSYSSLWKGCERDREWQRQDHRRWAVIWLIVSMVLGTMAGAQMVKQFDKDAGKVLDSILHAH